MSDEKTISIEMPVRTANLIIEALDVAVTKDTEAGKRSEQRRAMARSLREDVVRKLHDV